MIHRHGTNQEARPVVRSERPRGRKRIRNAPGATRTLRSSPDAEGQNPYGHLAQGKQAAHTGQFIYRCVSRIAALYRGEVAAVTIVSLPARGRPTEAAARRAGLEGCRESCNDSGGPFS
jgi:hypothetical protein